MANIELVIKIDEDDYAVILANADIVNKRKKHTLEEAVLNGTPLPKGHGRLIDTDAIDTSYSDPEVRETLDDAPTIIEADKEN